MEIRSWNKYMEMELELHALLDALPRRRRRRSGCESFIAPAPPSNCSLPATPRLCCSSLTSSALHAFIHHQGQFLGNTGQFLENTPNAITCLYYTYITKIR